MTILGDKLRQLATEADGATALALPRMVLAESGEPVYTDDGTQFAEDFWVKGMVGAQKGASTKHYADTMVLSMMGGTVPLHAHVLKAGPEDSNWNELLSTPADMGWIDGSGYYYNTALSPQDNEAVFVAFGRPTHNQHGAWDTFGKAMTDDGWAAWKKLKQEQAALR